MKHINNYQMLRKLKRMEMMNARENINEKLEKLGCPPVFYNSDTKRNEVIFPVRHKSGESEELTKQEKENLKKVKAICDIAKIDLHKVFIFQSMEFEAAD